jgi:hypothetical protein
MVCRANRSSSGRGFVVRNLTVQEILEEQIARKLMRHSPYGLLGNGVWAELFNLARRPGCFSFGEDVR